MEEGEEREREIKERESGERGERERREREKASINLPWQSLWLMLCNISLSATEKGRGLWALNVAAF